MRIVVFLLLAANLTLFIYLWLPSGGGGGFRLEQQIQPEKAKVLTPQEVAALGPAKVAALADVCVEFGPFSDVERAKVINDLEPLALGRLLTQRRVEFDNAYTVGISPFPSRNAAENRAGELRRQGVKDVTVADAGRGQFSVNFGAFRTEPPALAYAEELATLPGAYAPPRGMLVLAGPEGAAIGCVGLRPLDADTSRPDGVAGIGVAEVKRLYVRPAARGTGLGLRLARTVIDGARALGYRELKLDTLERMVEARALYARLGFRECAAYYHNPMPGAVYMSLLL